MTIADLDRLIGLEDFLREEGKVGEQTKITPEWHDAPGPGEEEQGKEADGPENAGQ
jgi:hypothetical protein